MQRKRGAYAVAASVILAIGVRVPHASDAPTHHAPEAGRADRVTACGMERWAVKTGMDPDARLVNQKVVVPTAIVHMRSLLAPAYLPLRSRLRPVETTVWVLDAVLLRYKVEEDSDKKLEATLSRHPIPPNVRSPCCALVASSAGPCTTSGVHHASLALQHMHEPSAARLGRRRIEHQAVLLPPHQRMARDGVDSSAGPRCPSPVFSVHAQPARERPLREHADHDPQHRSITGAHSLAVPVSTVHLMPSPL